MMIECVRYLSAILLFFFKQKTAYDMRISDWSSDVCSSDLVATCAERSATARSQVATGWQPAAVAMPCTLAITDWGRAVMVVISRLHRSEERRVGKECVSTCRYRWSAYH